jgi:hypothetical protein
MRYCCLAHTPWRCNTAQLENTATAQPEGTLHLFLLLASLALSLLLPCNLTTKREGFSWKGNKNTTHSTSRAVQCTHTAYSMRAPESLALPGRHVTHPDLKDGFVEVDAGPQEQGQLAAITYQGSHAVAYQHPPTRGQDAH